MRSLDSTEDFAIQLVRRFLVLCEHPRTRNRMLRMVARASQPGDDAPRIFRWLNRALLLPTMRRGTRPMSAIKWELVASQLFGVATMRYLHELEPIASAERETVVAMTAPSILAILRGPDEVFNSLVVDEVVEDEVEEGLSDFEDLSGIDEIIAAPEVPPRRPPAGGSALRRVH